MPDLIAETVGHVRVLRLNRPERKNALTPTLGWSIVRALADATDDDDVRVVVITGNGDAFCSGLDLGPGAGTSPDGGLTWSLPTLVGHENAALADAIAAQAPLAVRRTKRLVARSLLVTDIGARMVEEIRSAVAGLNSEDGQEAVRAIMEKRAPEFHGR